MKVSIKNRQRRIKVNRRRITGLLRKALHLLSVPRAELSILLVNDRQMRALNLQYRGLDKTTDVLSFPQSADCSIHDLRFTIHEVILGDIVINLHKARRQADEYGLTMNEEIKRLLIHGLLHLIGYDHEKNGYQGKMMLEKERELINILS